MDGRRGEGGSSVEEALGRLFPERSPALRIEEVVDRTRGLLDELGVDPVVWEERLTVRTVRYYRSKGIVSAPGGEGPNARYGRRHVLEAAAARLAGHLHHLSLADAAERIAALDDGGLVGLLGDLVEKEREDHAPRPLPGLSAAPRRPVSVPAGVAAGGPVRTSQVVAVHLPHGATLLLPQGHPALVRMPAERIGRAVGEMLEGGEEG